MPSEDTNLATRREWRELGFFYDRNDATRQWRITGSLDGLRVFARLLREYACDPAHNALSEHAHFGPYMYLEIGTWSEPVITGHWIAGPLDALSGLSASIVEKISSARPGDVLYMKAIFAPRAPYELALEVREDSFDAASADANCR